MSDQTVREPITGEGYAVASLDGLGDGWGFRKIRKDLAVAEFGVNAIVFPPRYDGGAHFHTDQEELYFVHAGEIEIVLHETDVHRLGAGGMARVDAATVRRVRNVSTQDAVVVIVGAKGGYVGRDGAEPEGDVPPGGPISD